MNRYTVIDPVLRKTLLAELGYRLMNRGRRGQYWLMLRNPMTLGEIDELLRDAFRSGLEKRHG